MTSVFISYSSQDREFANYIATELTRQKVDVFVDYQRLEAGNSFTGQLGKEIKSRDFLILLISQRSMESRWVRSEVKWANHHTKPIVPLIIEPVNIPDDLFFLIDLEQIDFTSWLTDRQVQHSIDKLNKALGVNSSSSIQSSISPIVSSISKRVPKVSEISTLTNHRGPVNAIGFSLGGILLASTSNDETIKLWSIPSGKELSTIKSIGGRGVSIAFDPHDNAVLICATEGTTVFQRTVKLWNVPSGREIGALVRQSAKLNSVAFSSDGKLVAAGFAPSNLSLFITATVKIWEMPSQKEFATYEGHSSITMDEERHSVDFVAFSPENRFLASDLGSNTIRIRDIYMSQRDFLVLTGHQSKVLHGAFSPDGTLFASASRDKTVKIWSFPDGKEIATLKGHTDAVRYISFAPDGSLLASASWDKTVRLWEIPSGRYLAKLEGHSGELSAVTFSPNGDLLVSSSQDGTIKIWKLE